MSDSDTGVGPDVRTPSPSARSSFFLTPRDHDCSFSPRNGESPRDDDQRARDTH